MSAKPAVSVVVPARDAAATLAPAVASALAQPEVDEVVVAVGPSQDETLQVARELARGDARVRVVDNPSGTTPAGLNAAIANSGGDVVVRLDAHAVLPPGYVAVATAVLEQTGAGNVGGRQVPTADEGFAASVAAAMRSVLGSGAATYRTGTRSGPSETVYLGVFQRHALDEVGGFDPTLLRNQDYELNHRLREAGWTVWFDPRLAVTYRPRSTVTGLARQYHDYGRFKRRVMRTHLSSIRLRQLAPLAMVTGIVGTTVISALFGWWWLGPAALAAYASLLLAGGLVAAPDRVVSVAVALAVMHWSWAIGFMRGPGRIEQPRRRDTGDEPHG